MTPGNYRGIKHVVRIATHDSQWCEHCSGVEIGSKNFAESINHYIEKHGYKLLHIGSETGDNLIMTVALLGK